jgi:undecaprenyl phosphate N,N'-diacetylbacillosamine 1-phosphate transferase
MSLSSVKRAFDVAGACAGLVVFAPVMAIVLAAVWTDDGFPLLFRQPRVGYRRRPFFILKIRTMRDGRTTRVGKVLRATGLDEVPQLINILAGDMSAVGPRPLTASDVERLGWTRADCDFRWEQKPGLTGLAQIAGAASSNEALEFDRMYTRRWHPLLDCELIALSFAVNVFGKSRVQRRFRMRPRRSESLDEPAAELGARNQTLVVAAEEAIPVSCDNVVQTIEGRRRQEDAEERRRAPRPA